MILFTHRSPVTLTGRSLVGCLSLQVFDILPLYGVLRPYSSHQISFTFYGHCDIIARAKALCEVEGGPTYEILLKGEASLVNYSFDTKDINYGLQVLYTSGRRVSGFALNMACGPHDSIMTPAAHPHSAPLPQSPFAVFFTRSSRCLLHFSMRGCSLSLLSLSLALASHTPPVRGSKAFLLPRPAHPTYPQCAAFPSYPPQSHSAALQSYHRPYLDNYFDVFDFDLERPGVMQTPRLTSNPLL